MSLNQEKKIKIGTQVLIFNYNPYIKKQNEDNFIKGRIESYDIVNKSIWNIYIYKVLGEDGKTYFGTYDMGLDDINPKIHNYFRSIEDHIMQTRYTIKSNCKMINELNEENAKLYELITNLSILEYEKSEEELRTSDKIDNTVYEKEFNSLEEKSIILADLNAKRYRRNILIKRK